MANIKKSVKVEITPEPNDKPSDILVDSVLAAFENMGLSDKELTEKFFTLRIDATEQGGTAATVTCSPKRG